MCITDQRRSIRKHLSTTPFSYICGRASIDLTAALFGVHSLGLHTALPQLAYSPHIRLSARYAL